MSTPDYDIAVFGTNEAPTIAQCLMAIDRAVSGRSARIAVLLNGTTDNSLEIIRSTRIENAGLTVYLFQDADKANAINWFIYELRVKAGTYFCIDAYTRIGPGALSALERALREDTNALIASAVPTNGRSATATRESTLRGGRVSGQLYAMKPVFLDRLVAAGYRLPLGIYRGDPLLGSMAAHDLDAIGEKWDSRRIIGVAEATFEISPLSPFRWRDIVRQYKREIRQARGALENEAIKSIIYTKGYAALPADANNMISEWLRSHRIRPASIRQAYFMRLARRRLDAPAREASRGIPQMLLESR
ncbi:MAG: glycosyltransferase family A protein [Stellaceae bacterium]